MSKEGSFASLVDIAKEQTEEDNTRWDQANTARANLPVTLNTAENAAQVNQDMYTGVTNFHYDPVSKTGKWSGKSHIVNQDDIDKWAQAGYLSGDATLFSVGSEGSDPFNKYSENNDTRSNNEEDPPIEAVTLSAGTSFDPSGWQLTPAPYVPYTPPAAQDWGAWVLGSPFGGQGGLAYQPGSREYLTRFIPENVWGSRSGLSQGVLAELAPSTGGLLSEALPRYESRGVRGSLSNATSSATSSASPGLLAALDKPYDDTPDGSLGVTEVAYGNYMRRHPDLMDDYNKNWKKKGVTPEEYGAMHYWEYGKKEGRV